MPELGIALHSMLIGFTLGVRRPMPITCLPHINEQSGHNISQVLELGILALGVSETPAAAA